MDESTKDDSNTDKLNTFRKWGINMGSRLWTNPHKKNNEVIKIIASLFLFVGIVKKQFVML